MELQTALGASQGEPEGTTVVKPDVGTTPEVGKFVNPDGTLQPGWKEELVPEEFRGFQVYDSFVDLGTLMKLVGNQDALIKRQGKGVFPPGENASPSELEAFYNAIGRPHKPEDYKVEVPKGLEAYYDDPLMNEARVELHKAGLTQKQVDVVLALDAKRLVAGEQELQAAEEAELKDAESALRVKWGAAYDGKLHLARRVWADNTPDVDKDKVQAAVGNNPVLVELLANIGKRLLEHGMPKDDGSTPGALTPGEAESKMKDLIAERGMDTQMRWNNPEKYKRLCSEIDRLAALSLEGKT